MRSKTKVLIAAMLGLISIFAGSVCAQPVIKPMPMPLDQRLPVRVAIPDDELGIDTLQTSIIGQRFGLIGAAITSEIDKNSKQSTLQGVAPLREKLKGYLFSERLDAALRSKVASDGLSRAPLFGKDALEDQVAEHTIHIVPLYTIDHDFERLQVRLNISVMRREKGKSRLRLPRYYAFDIVMDIEKLEDRLRAWQTFERSQLEAMLDDGIAQTVDMLVYDFSNQGRAEWNRPTLKKGATIKGHRISGLPVRQGEDWVWVRGAARKGPGAMLYGYGIQGYRLIGSENPRNAEEEPAPSR